MVTRTPVYKLLFGAGIVSVVGILLIFKLTAGSHQYVPGQTVEYHPPATEEVEATEAALDELSPPKTAAGKTEHLFVPRLAEGKPLAIETRLSHERVSVDAKTGMHAAIAVRAGELSELVGSQEAAEAERAGLNIALVIDRSGSMTGMKLHNAKAAARALVDYLGPRDRLAVVSYGSDVTTLAESLRVTESNRDKLHGAVASIRCHGGTNLSGGFLRGRELVQAAAGGDRISRVLLLSDGQANEGITGVNELGAVASHTLESGISVTTMGVGLDYNEDLLQKMATSGAGNYYFIEDASTTEHVFAAELHGLKSTVARGVELRLSPGPGAEVVHVSGVNYRRRGSDVVIDLDTFSAGEQTDLLAEMSFDADVVGERLALETRLIYTDVASERGIVDHVGLAVDVTSSGRVQTDPLVMRRVLHLRTAAAFSAAMKLYDRGDRFAAADLVDERREETREFVDTNHIDDPQVEQIDAAFERLAESLRKTERHTSKGKWIAKHTKFNSANASVSSQVSF